MKFKDLAVQENLMIRVIQARKHLPYAFKHLFSELLPDIYGTEKGLTRLNNNHKLYSTSEEVTTHMEIVAKHYKVFFEAAKAELEAEVKRSREAAQQQQQAELEPAA